MKSREEKLAYWKEYNKLRDPEKELLRGRTRYEAYRNKAMGAIGPACCNSCGHADVRVLEIDHLYVRGIIHRKSRTWYSYFRDMWESPEDYQLLCANCHVIKTHYSGERGADGISFSIRASTGLAYGSLVGYLFGLEMLGLRKS